MRESKERSSGSASGGIGFSSALTLLFIGLKLAHVIEWSWVWVLSPVWISAIIFVVLLIFICWLNS